MLCEDCQHCAYCTITAKKVPISSNFILGYSLELVRAELCMVQVRAVKKLKPSEVWPLDIWLSRCFCVMPWRRPSYIKVTCWSGVLGIARGALQPERYMNRPVAIMSTIILIDSIQCFAGHKNITVFSIAYDKGSSLCRFP